MTQEQKIIRVLRQRQPRIRAHTRTKAKSPQTNGICERFHRTVLDEFYRVAFRKIQRGSDSTKISGSFHKLAPNASLEITALNRRTAWVLSMVSRA